MTDTVSEGLAKTERAIAENMPHAIGYIAATIDNPQVPLSRYVEMFEEFDELGPLFTVAVVRAAAALAASAQMTGTDVLAMFATVSGDAFAPAQTAPTT